MRTTQPIGIFDSGVGGLPIARAIKQRLPNEAIYYVGDTAHMPYGTCTTAQLQAYAKSIGQLLQAQSCKLILIACNTAAAAATATLRDYVGPSTPVVDVVDPLVEHMCCQWRGQTVGLIGTDYTIQSGIYPQKLANCQAAIQLQTVATPLLAPMIELDNLQIEVLEAYLAHPHLQDMAALALGCTHYVLIQPHITRFYEGRVCIIDNAAVMGLFLQGFLASRNLLNLDKPIYPDRFLATKLTPHFQKITYRYFGQEAGAVVAQTDVPALEHATPTVVS